MPTYTLHVSRRRVDLERDGRSLGGWETPKGGPGFRSRTYEATLDGESWNLTTGVFRRGVELTRPGGPVITLVETTQWPWNPFARQRWEVRRTGSTYLVEQSTLLRGNVRIFRDGDDVGTGHRTVLNGAIRIDVVPDVPPADALVLLHAVSNATEPSFGGPG